MYDPSNPYASPMSSQMDPVAAQWLGTPSASLTKVANGLGLIYIGIVLMLLSAIGGGILMAVLRSPMVLILIGLGAIVAAILNIVGTLFCLATPEETGAQGMIYASAVALGINIAISIGTNLGFLPGSLGNVGTIASIVGGITFLLFLKRLSLFIGRQDLAAKAQSILIWCIGLVVAFIAAFAITIGSGVMAFANVAGGQEPRLDAGAAGGAAIGGLLMIVVLIAGLITFVRYANLLTYIKTAILSGGRG